MKIFDYSKLANLKWDNELVGLVSQIHEYKGRQELYLKQKHEELTKLIEIAKIQSTEASNKIEGIVTTSIRIKQMFMENAVPRTRDEEEIMGYKDVLNIIHENFEYIPIRSSYILQLHKELYKYSEKSFGGNYKNVQNYISEKRNDGSEFIRFTPLEPYETPEAITSLCDNYNKAIDDCSADALVLIPLFILDFLCIHPFNDGNGRMSRLLTTLLLYKSGYVVGRYISLETKIEKNKNMYYETLEYSSKNWKEESNDPIPFIKYILGIILAAYREFEDRIDMVSPKQSARVQVENAVFKTIGKFTKSSISELCPNIGRASVENALRALVSEGLIVKHGNGKNTFYVRVFDK